MEQYISELNNKIKIALKEVKENINGAGNGAKEERQDEGCSLVYK